MMDWLNRYTPELMADLQAVLLNLRKDDEWER
jgi:hypothetical protein